MTGTTMPVNGKAPYQKKDWLSGAGLCPRQSKVMRSLECPFNWSAMAVLDQHDADLMVDRLPLAVRPWDSIIKKCHLAFSELERSGCVQQSLAFLTECFMPLLKIQGFETDCELTKLYRQALKHVIDATSAFIHLASCKDSKSQKDLGDFVETIPTFDSMDQKQRAAVHAIRSLLSKHPQNLLWTRVAVELNPEEGQWHSYLADALYFADQSRLNSYEDEGKERDELFNEIMKHNSDALTLRRDAPEPFILMANLLVGFGEQKQSNDSYMLVQNALKKFPNSAYVHEKAADVLQLSQPSFNYLPKSYLLIEPFYKKALKLAGKGCLSVRHKLGLHQVLFGRLNIENYEGTYDEGVENLKLAATLIPDARVHLKQLSEGTLDVRALGVNLPPFAILDEDESSSEDSQLDRPRFKKNKKKRKKRKN